VLRGRAFDAGDRNRNVVIVSARLAAVLFPGRSALGHKLSSGSSIENAEIVGIVSDVHTTSLDRDPTLMIYAPFWKAAYQVSDVVVRSSAGPRALENDVRRALQSIDASIPPPKMRTMQELVDHSVAQRRFQMNVAAGFGAAALLLATLGIYGVVAYGISMRRREIGVRMALGARAGQVRGMLLGRGLRPVAAGLVIGLLASAAAGQAVRGLLFGVAPTDALTLAAVTFTLALVATLACLAPAESAARMNPANVLRED
jgi:ABC-type antimicrobial peptide transport system permease subunit